MEKEDSSMEDVSVRSHHTGGKCELLVEKMKRKQKRPEEKQRPRKTRRTHISADRKGVDGIENLEKIESDENAEFSSPWRNLQLILSIKNKDNDLQKKVVLAHDFVTRVAAAGIEVAEEHETVKTAQVVVFLSDWIQSLLVSADGKTTRDQKKKYSEEVEACLDCRCWDIFKFCLEESLKFHVPLSLSRNLLRSIQCIAQNSISLLNMHLNSSRTDMVSKDLEGYTVVLDCVALVFSSHGGLLNENLDLWILSVDAVLDLLLKVYEKKLENGSIGFFPLRLAYLVLQPFSKFLRVHPTKKNAFHYLTNKLLEPLLHLLGIFQSNSHGSNTGCSRNLQATCEEVLSHGLFHSVHIGGFLSFRGLEKYSLPSEGITQDSKAVNKSYHRHLFDKLEKIIGGNKEFVLRGVGELFHLLVDQVKQQNRVPTGYNYREVTGKAEGSLDKKISATSDKSYCSGNLNVDAKKSVLNFFVQVMDPLLLQLNAYLQAKLQVFPALLDARWTLKSINSLLATFIRETVHVKTEDFSEGACLGFLKKIYDTIVSVASNLVSLWKNNVGGPRQEVFGSLAKELLTALGYLVDIEYEVIDADLITLWLIILSFQAFCLSSAGAFDHCSLTSQIQNFGCQLVKLYSELRQVENAVFALCKGIRFIVQREIDCDLKYASFLPCGTSLLYGIYIKSVEILLCSHNLNIAFHRAIKSIPEGNAKECIRLLILDLSDSMEWMKSGSSRTLDFNLQAELLGKGLSDIYTQVLNSLIVTMGNSRLVGDSIEDLVTVIRPYMCNWDGKLTTINEFLFFLTGGTFENKTDEKEKTILKFGASSHWIFVFFFRLYISCRSLYRQVISLMAPDRARKMSAAMGDSFMSYSGKDWLENTEWTKEGYFSWIMHPSASLHAIIRSLSDTYLKNGFADSSSLIPVMTMMAIQRLVDLNRQIKSLEYLLQNNDLLKIELLDEGELLSCCRKNKKWSRHLTGHKQEAAGLTEFIVSYLPLLSNDQLAISSSDDAACMNTLVQNLHHTDRLDLGLGMGSVKSLPTVMWRILCQNTDVWCAHAAKRKLKMFISQLIRSSLSSRSTFDEIGKQQVDIQDLSKPASHQISSELLSDAALYENKFLCRHFPSRFCHTLEKSVLPLFKDLPQGNIDFNVLPNWEEVLETLENSPMFKLLPSSSKKLPAEFHSEQQALTATDGATFRNCQSLLDLLCWMPKDYLKSRSFSLYITCILNLERLVVGSLLECQDALSSQENYELLRLIVSCRRVLKYLIMAFCNKRESTQYLHIPLLSENSCVLWLFKSVTAVIRLEESLLNCEVKSGSMIFSLMDHTSHILLALSRYQFNNAFDAAMNVDRLFVEQPFLVDHEKNYSLDSSKCIEVCKILSQMVNMLKEHMPSLDNMKHVLCCEKFGVGERVTSINELSLVLSSFSAFLWGLASALNPSDGKEDIIAKVKSLESKREPISCLYLQINVVLDFITLSLHMLVIEGLHQHDNVSDDQNFQKPNILAAVDSYECLGLKKPFLRSLLKGDCPEASFFLKELLIAFSAILRLNLKTTGSPSLSKLVPVFLGISEEVLLEFANMTKSPQTFSFVLLDGVLKFLEELTRHFPSNATLTRHVYTKLIVLHLKVLGKCICLQGKEATLASHELESSVKTLVNHGDRKFLHLDEFKARLRMLFKVLIKKASRVDILSAMQAIERSLVGVQEDCTAIYQINTGSAEGGKVSSIVASGVDCLDLVLENVSGPKRLSAVKKYIQGFIPGLFNIILHLQSRLIFYKKSFTSKCDNYPDQGSVILMCVEVLARISGKHSMYHMDSWHVGQALHIPAALFQDFHQVRLTEAPVPSHSYHKRDSEPVAVVTPSVVDSQFSVNLFASCCRLSYTVLKHHKSESEQCIVFLEESVRVLLNCLEMVDTSLDRKGYFSWRMQEGVKCASSLRRIYEEIREQRNVFGQHCFKFLSAYVWVYSGYGPLKIGIKRDIDKALRPGVYALIDACSPDDLQYLHALFGEGPCRSTLAALKHDYKLNFQYGGKV